MIYAVGDIHGRADLLDVMIGLITSDIQKSGAAEAEVVFLGDYVDRGLQTKRVIDTLIALADNAPFKATMLRGNHDQYLLEFTRAPSTWTMWRRLGGAATMQSYGVSPPGPEADQKELDAVAQELRHKIGDRHLEFLKATELFRAIGDYVFVHAGVKPGVPLERQEPRDLMGIRGEFLDAADPMPGKLVIYGHTPVDSPKIQEGKLGIDTGAYASGVLTAVRIHEDKLTLIQATAARR